MYSSIDKNDKIMYNVPNKIDVSIKNEICILINTRRYIFFFIVFIRYFNNMYIAIYTIG